MRVCVRVFMCVCVRACVCVCVCVCTCVSVSTTFGHFFPPLRLSVVMDVFAELSPSWFAKHPLNKA